MESELSGIFRVKLVTKNTVRGSQGTQFMHMRVKAFIKLFQFFYNAFVFKPSQILSLVLTFISYEIKLRFR